MYAWSQKQSNTSLIGTYNLCQCLFTIKKNLLIDFDTRLSILIDWNGNSNDPIFIIVKCYIKMVYYKPVKIIINVLGLKKVIINVVMRHHGFSDSIVTD